MLFDEENYPTTTSYEQCSCERVCSQLLNQFICGESSSFTKFRDEGVINAENEIRLLRRSHADYLIHNFDELPAGFVSLDASRPWIIYWILHSLYLLGVNTRSFHERIISTLQCIQNKSGGFGGGPMQISQGAPNYAAVLSLCMIGSSEALSSVDRQAMYRWFLRLKQPSGGFSIHIDGETDTRSTYTVISISRLLNILTPELTQGVADFVLKCQTYEGGFGGEPGNEAHGGYNFCALATLLILGDYRRCNLVLLEKWLLNRQMKFEGGFQGRTNKLVDSCYSFWQGSAAAILEVMKLGGNDLYDVQLFFTERTQNIVPDAPDAELQFSDHGLNVVSNYSGSLPFNQYALQKYILHCAQNFDYGGMRDKPGKSRDFYHCCYSLSGLSVSQRSITAPLQFDECRRNHIVTSIPVVDQFWTGPQVYGDSDNLLEPTSIVYNIGVSSVQNSLNYFKSFANDHSILCE